MLDLTAVKIFYIVFHQLGHRLNRGDKETPNNVT